MDGWCARAGPASDLPVFFYCVWFCACWVSFIILLRTAVKLVLPGKKVSSSFNLLERLYLLAGLQAPGYSFPGRAGGGSLREGGLGISPQTAPFVTGTHINGGKWMNSWIDRWNSLFYLIVHDMVVFHWHTGTRLADLHNKETLVTAQLQLASIFYCRRVSLVKVLPDLESDSDVKPRRCIYIVHTVYIMIYYVLISCNTSVWITCYVSIKLAELTFARVNLITNPLT